METTEVFSFIKDFGFPVVLSWFLLVRMENKLAGLKLVISEQATSLQTANRLLKQYEEEEKYKLRKVKRQRNIAYVIATAAVIFAVRKAVN